MQSENIQELYRQWVTDYYQDVYRWCFRYVGNAHDAADLTQETFMNAFRHANTFRGDASPRTWLLAIATRVFLRSARKNPHHASVDDDVGLPSQAQSAEQAAVEKFERAEIWTWVHELAHHERIAITLFYGEDLSYDEIAQVMNVNLQQVKNFIHRGRKHLKQRVEGGGER